MKRILLLAGAVAGAVAFAPAAYAGQGVGGCQLDGSASFAKPLSINAVTTTYSFSGTLSNCQGTFPEKGGTVSAGVPFTVNGVQYQPLDTPTLTGGCSNSDTAGTAVVVWDNNKVSVISYTTKGAAAAVALTGTFKSAQTATTTPDANGNTTTTSLPLAYGGDYAGGPLAFEPPDPTACNGAGVGAAGIQGFIGHGNYQ